MTKLSYDKLSDAAVKEALSGLPGWTLEGGMVTKEFAFDSYSSGLVFAVACGHMADRLNHHPDLFVGYKKVRVSFVTHDAGGLTAYDMEAARRVQALA
jgi:4a-hydroxytetrahydrobiopterin dehydratase